MIRRNKIKNFNNSSSKERFNLKSLRVYVLGGICAVLAVSSIFLTLDAATSGAEISDLQHQQSALLAQQQDLKEALVENLSVNSLQEKSSELGFVRVSNLVYVADSAAISGIPVAKLPDTGIVR